MRFAREWSYYLGPLTFRIVPLPMHSIGLLDGTIQAFTFLLSLYLKEGYLIPYYAPINIMPHLHP